MSPSPPRPRRDPPRATLERRRPRGLARLVGGAFGLPLGLPATLWLSLFACSSKLVVISSGGGAGGHVSTGGRGGGGAGAGGSGGEGGGEVQCITQPTTLATLEPLAAVEPVVSGTDLFFVAQSATGRTVRRVSLVDGTVSPVGSLGPADATHMPKRLAASDAVYVLEGAPDQLVLFPRAGGLPAQVPVPGDPETIRDRVGGGVSWVRLDHASTFLTSPFVYGETAPGPAFTTDDVHRFDDDPVFPPVGSRDATFPGFPWLFGRGAAVRYFAPLPSEVIVGRFDGATGAHVVAIHEPTTPATCPPGETPTNAGGVIGASLFDPADEPEGSRLAYWITRSNDCQAGAAAPKNRTTAELVALDTQSGMRLLLSPPTPFPAPRTSPGPLFIDAGEVLFAPPSGPPRLARVPIGGGADSTVLSGVVPAYVGVVGNCVVVVDQATSPPRVVTVLRNAPPT